MTLEDWGQPAEGLLSEEEVPQTVEFDPEYEAAVARLNEEAERAGMVEVIPDDYDYNEVVDADEGE